MDASRDHDTTLVDLLDRVLDKGLVLHADVIISVSGIPLIGLKLSALLASVDTMIQYGIWEDWDCAIRAAATDAERRRLQEEQKCLDGEYPVLRSFCSCRQKNKNGEPWTSATFFLTRSRIVVADRKKPAILCEAPLQRIAGYSVHEGNTEGSAIFYLDLLLDDGSIIALRSIDTAALAEKIGTEMKRQGLSWQEQDSSLLPTGADPVQKVPMPPVHGTGT